MGSILEIIAKLLGLTDFIVRRRAAKADDPVEQNKKRYEQIDKDIASQNSTAATSHATYDLDALDRLQNRSGDKRGPD